MSQMCDETPLTPDDDTQSRLVYDEYPLVDPLSIRLIRLLSGNGKAPVTCVMTTKRLEDAPVYQALSYAWGSPEKKRHIDVRVDSKPGAVRSLPVTKNCLHLLRHLRNNSLIDLPIWIDAVCIDQASGEKNHQVKLMHQIYSKASRVVVYPGPEFQDPVEMEEFLQFTENPKFTERGVPRPLKAVLQTLPLLDQPWFNRTWVLQEVILARKAEVILGRRTVPWPSFTAAAKALVDFGNKVRVFRRLIGDGETAMQEQFKLPPIISITYSMANHSKSTDHELADLLFLTQGLAASDPRDKIYALLGLCSDTESLPPIQYLASKDEVYASFALALIDKSGTLDVFITNTKLLDMHKPHPDESTESTDAARYDFSRRDDPTWKAHQQQRTLAHWVPDWEYAPDLQGLQVENLSRTNLFSAHGGIRAHARTRSRDTVNPLKQHLLARGKPLGRIKAAGPIFDFNKHWGWPHFAAFFARGVLPFLSRHCESEQPKEVCARVAMFRLLIEDAERERPAAIEIGGRSLSLETAFWAKIDRLADVAVGAGARLPVELQIRHGERALFKYLYGRRFFVTDRGHVGLGPSFLGRGDLACCLAGAAVPYVLSDSDKGDNMFQLIGECYVDGVMQGEAMEGREGELETFELI